MVGYAQLRAWKPDALAGSARSWRQINVDVTAAADRLRFDVAAPLLRIDAVTTAVARARALADSIAARGRVAARLAAELTRTAADLTAAKAELDRAVAHVEAHDHLRISPGGDVSVESMSELHRRYPDLDVGTLVGVSVAASDAAAAAQDRVDGALRRATVRDTAAAETLRGLLDPDHRPGAPGPDGGWNVRFGAATGLIGRNRRLWTSD